MASGTLEVMSARALDSSWNDIEIHERLLEWKEQRDETSRKLDSFAVVFGGPGGLDEAGFERLMWQRLQRLVDKDSLLGGKLDPDVSGDAEDPHFAISIDGASFFVVGLHPDASRPARRTPLPILVFNPHDQFERLREEGRFERMRERILTRDVAMSGSINPMLADHGEASAARQFSGRSVGKDWQCPFQDPRL